MSCQADFFSSAVHYGTKYSMQIEPQNGENEVKNKAWTDMRTVQEVLHLVKSAGGKTCHGFKSMVSRWSLEKLRGKTLMIPILQCFHHPVVFPSLMSTANHSSTFTPPFTTLSQGFQVGDAAKWGGTKHARLLSVPRSDIFCDLTLRKWLLSPSTSWPPESLFLSWE